MRDRPTPTRLSNEVCHTICVLWLFVAVPITFFVRPTYQDFSLYYMAGVCARTGNFDALYPNVPPNTTELDCDPALLKPKLLALAKGWNVDLSMPYLQPAWNAIFFAPLTFLPYRLAHALWIAILILSTYGMTLFAAKTYRVCAPTESRMCGVAMLIVALSPLAYRTIRVGNVSAVVGLVIAFTTFEMARRDGVRSALAIWIGGILKYATVMFLPLLILTKRWRTIAWVGAFGVVTILMAYMIAGPGPFRDYTVIAQEIGKSIRYPGNQSLHGFLLRATHQSPAPEWASVLLNGGQAVVGIGLLALIIRRRNELRTNPPIVFAAVVASVAWLMIFAPFFWDHYHIYFAPFWGWMLWEASQSMLKRVIAVAAISLAWVPLPAALWFHWPEPFGSYMLWSVCLMLVLAVMRLLARNEPAVLRTAAN
jgi:hypothetical protein